MGGAFSPQQTPAQVIGTTPPEIQPLQAALIQAVSSLFTNPRASGVTPLEESTIRGAYQQAAPAQDVLNETVTGRYLPGQPNANPFLEALYAGLNRQGEGAQRQLAAAAQRSGALNSTDYLRQASDLSANLAERQGGILSSLWGQERGNQLNAIPGLQSLGQSLLQMASLPRTVATQETYRPFDYASGLVGRPSASVVPGQSQPSPFASILSGLAPFAQFVHF